MNPRLQRALRLSRALPGASGGVVHQLPGETAEQTLERAEREGRTGGLLVMPAPVSVEQWQAETEAQQRELQQRAARYLASGWAGIFDPLQEQPDGAPSR